MSVITELQRPLSIPAEVPPNGVESESLGEILGIGTQSVSLGWNSSATDEAVAVGESSIANNRSVAMGKDASASPDAVAIGFQALAAINGVAVGIQAQATEDGCIAVGTNTLATGGVNAIAIGHQALADETLNVVVGSLSRTTGGPGATGNTVLGTSNESITTSATIIGRNVNLWQNSDGTVAIGKNIPGVVGRDEAVVIGSALTFNQQSVAIQGNAGLEAVSLGNTVGPSTGDRSVSIGFGAGAVAIDSVAVGSGATCLAANGVAIGRSASATGADAIAIGVSSSAAAGICSMGSVPSPVNRFWARKSVGNSPFEAILSPAVDGLTGLYIVCHTSGSPIVRNVTMEAAALGFRRLQVAA